MARQGPIATAAPSGALCVCKNSIPNAAPSGVLSVSKTNVPDGSALKNMSKSAAPPANVSSKGSCCQHPWQAGKLQRALTTATETMVDVLENGITMATTLSDQHWKT
eukprot:CAMPEP_0117619904 /NCGR_PEP_ID=MMETSP0784-20121206/86855_1 /TAXON_ID=39447 /ORGANISM="" /LENGTH=106 /DNA_ID=CAMNT_0005423805 /DNA_START=795 /DNA_END=1111 /DNA_ORIENTATION=+